MSNIFQNFPERVYRIFIEEEGYKLMLEGLQHTILIALCSLVIGIVMGTLLSVVKVTPRTNPIVRVLHFLADVYITVIRGTPVVVQLLLIYFAILSPLGWDALVVAILVFGINSSAYVAEIIRGGILAVDKGQMEAGRSLGLNKFQGQMEAGRSLGLSYGTTMLRIVLPQAIKNILPALGNEFIVLIKETSVASFITVTDLTRAAQSLNGKYYDVFVTYLVLAVVYLVLVMIATFFVNLMERRLRRSDNR